MINIRNKGAEGEREIARLLNQWVSEVRLAERLPALDKRDELFQRNQNQSAVGGADLSSVLPLEIEVKRQEAVSVKAWWKQTITSSCRTSRAPVLIYRQSRKKWRVVMLANVAYGGRDNNSLSYECEVEITLENFKKWFLLFYRNWL